MRPALNTARTATGEIMREDTVGLMSLRGTVMRVASDESWVDVAWWNPDGSYGWTKRQYRPELLVRLGPGGVNP